VSCDARPWKKRESPEGPSWRDESERGGRGDGAFNPRQPLLLPSASPPHAKSPRGLAPVRPAILDTRGSGDAPRRRSKARRRDGFENNRRPSHLARAGGPASSRPGSELNDRRAKKYPVGQRRPPAAGLSSRGNIGSSPLSSAQGPPNRRRIPFCKTPAPLEPWSGR